jgi:hypothetical protein
VEGKSKPDWQIAYSDSSSARVQTSAPARAVVRLSSSATASISLQITTTMDREATTTVAPATPAPAPAASAPAKRLYASQVGVPAGTPLTQHYGNLTITQAGTVIDRMDIHGNVFVKAPNVRITRSIVRGGPSTYEVGTITSTDQPGLVVEDSDLKVAQPSVKMNGIKGNNFTLRRVHVQGGVDSVIIVGDNVRIESSLLENMNYFDHDPSQNNGPTHNDNIQILKGRNLVITGTTALAANLNFAILAGAEYGDVSVKIANNYVDGGHCNVKIAVRNGHAGSASVTGNMFGPHIKEPSCPLVAERAISLTQANNFAEIGGRTIIALRI